jgi:HEAT repeat protein
VGCSGSWHFQKSPVFVTEADAARYLREALNGAGADDRREAIQQISRTRFVSQATVVEGMSTIARTDHSPSVRCAAVRALALAQAEPAAAPLLAILSEHPENAGCLPPDDTVRWDALDALLPRAQRGALPAEQQAELSESARRLLAGNASRDVRMAAARILGCLPRPEVLSALVDALRQRDFGVVYEADRSLMALTGHDFQHDPAAWSQWLEKTNDPFAERGRLDARMRPARSGWWSSTTESFKRGLARFAPKQES